jgi:hypothetical protein
MAVASLSAIGKGRNFFPKCNVAETATVVFCSANAEIGHEGVGQLVLLSESADAVLEGGWPS